MATDIETPKLDPTPNPTPSLPQSVVANNVASSLPQKRALEDDHVPAVSSPLNPNPDPKPAKTQSQDEVPTMSREKRTKKESLKKRESKGVTIAESGSSRATPEPKGKNTKELSPNESSPMRYKLAPPKPSDFEPARGPVFTQHHDVATPDGSSIEFHETSEQ
jgi:COMPASS component BRE2